jgi:hypothetical protein
MVVASIISWPGATFGQSARTMQALRDYDRAVEMVDLQQFDAAHKLLQQTLTTIPEPAPSLRRSGLFFGPYYPFFYLGRALMGLGRGPEAADAFRQSLAKNELRDAPSLSAERARLLNQIELQSRLGVQSDLIAPALMLEGLEASLFTEAEVLEINGQPARVAEVLQDGKSIRFLGDVKQGANRLRTKVGEVLFWVELNRMRLFTNPYKNSYAVLAAVGNYASASGFERVDGMVERARDLAGVLQRVGFPRSQIIELYDADATSGRIDSVLKEFWPGGKYEGADHVFLYFGGHGTVSPSSENALLVTHDFDRRRPSATGLPIRSLLQVHAQEIGAKHLLFAFDSCHSGLAGPTTLSETLNEDALREFQKLSVIDGDTKSKVRQVLVAGTGNEKALYQNGGIFTQALIDGLKGGSDWNRDGLVQFPELALFVRNSVISKARQTGYEQKPSFYTISGDGQFLFILQR